MSVVVSRAPADMIELWIDDQRVDLTGVNFLDDAEWVRGAAWSFAGTLFRRRPSRGWCKHVRARKAAERRQHAPR